MRHWRYESPCRLFAVQLCAPSAEVRTLTLRDALDIALKQNPDVLLARLDQQRARAQVTIEKDPFVPKLFAGSGAAYTNGFPMSIDGNAPAMLQAKTPMTIFDRPRTIARRKPMKRSAAWKSISDYSRRRSPTAWPRCSSTPTKPSRSLAAVERQLESLARVRDLTGVRVSEGRELAIESSKAESEGTSGPAAQGAIDRSHRRRRNVAGAGAGVRSGRPGPSGAGRTPTDRMRPTRK